MLQAAKFSTQGFSEGDVSLACTVAAEKVAQELLAAEEAKLAAAAAKRQKKAQKKKKQTQNKQLHSVVPQEVEVAEVEVSNNGAGPSMDPDTLSAVQEVRSLYIVHCICIKHINMIYAS